MKSIWVYFIKALPFYVLVSFRRLCIYFRSWSVSDPHNFDAMWTMWENTLYFNIGNRGVRSVAEIGAKVCIALLYFTVNKGKCLDPKLVASRATSTRWLQGLPSHKQPKLLAITRCNLQHEKEKRMLIGHSRVLYKQQIQEVCRHGLLPNVVLPLLTKTKFRSPSEAVFWRHKIPLIISSDTFFRRSPFSWNVVLKH
jgi:hypothetical protein